MGLGISTVRIIKWYMFSKRKKNQMYISTTSKLPGISDLWCVHDMGPQFSDAWSWRFLIALRPIGQVTCGPRCRCLPRLPNPRDPSPPIPATHLDPLSVSGRAAAAGQGGGRAWQQRAPALAPTTTSQHPGRATAAGQGGGRAGQRPVQAGSRPHGLTRINATQQGNGW